MDNDVFYLVVLYVISMIITVGFSVFFYLSAKWTSLLKRFLALQGVMFLWLLNKVLVALSPNDYLGWIFTVIQYFSVCTMGIFFLDFAYYYYHNKLIEKKMRIFLYALSFINYIGMVTNPLHHLFFTIFTPLLKTYGVLFYWHVTCSYFMIFLADLYLLIGMYHNSQTSKGVRVLFSLGILLPLITNVLHVFKLTPIRLDITPIMFNTTFLVFGYASYRFTFIDIRSVTRRVVFENLNEGVFVIDENRQIIRINAIVNKLMKGINTFHNNAPLSQVLEESSRYIKNHVDLKTTMDSFFENHLEYSQIDLQIDGDKREITLRLIIRRLTERKKSYTVFRLIDLTRYTLAQKELQSKNESLKSIHNELSQEISVLSTLAITKERNRISKELHDILGHSLTIVIALLQISKASVKMDKQLAKHKIIQTRDIIRSGYTDLKKALEGHVTEGISSKKLCDDIVRLTEQTKTLGTEVEVIFRNKLVFVDPPIYDAIYRSCQEGLTNAIRHGQAKNVTIGLRMDQEGLDLIIADDGKGCKGLKKGNGLTGMEQRTTDLGGSFSCGSPEGEGFSVHVRIPLSQNIQ